MSVDDPTYRQLRFSFILQTIGAVLFAIATIVRVFLDGFAVTTLLFAAATILIAALARWTYRRLQAMREA
jgi:uncharacterized membrane protein